MPSDFGEVPWFGFLHFRKLCIMELIHDGKSFEEIAVILSMNPSQVQRISESRVK